MKASSTALKEARLLKECSDAYLYAVEVSEKTNSDWAVKSSVEQCQECVEESLIITKNKKIHDLCLEYVHLCENIKNTQSTRWRNQDADEKRKFKPVQRMSE
ncbi:hypothetical protein [Halobacillus campisalis]|uniref:Uncharacterized protein n=1 Tax=Halobacillus campisalis TaxID=435909 RepID=A0ABW2JZN1_9BACI|nr:hypothetical protein [Halobacillus campisalis]